MWTVAVLLLLLPLCSGRLLSISFDDTLRVWQDPAGPDSSSCKLQQAVSDAASASRSA